MSARQGAGAEVRINGSARRLPPGTSVAALVHSYGWGPAGIAVAVNQEVVSKGRWEGTLLADGDEVEIMTAVQGG